MEKEQSKRLLISRLFAVLSVLFVFMAGYLVGSHRDNVKDGVDLTRFWQVYNLISNKYPGEIDRSKLIEGAIRGMVDGLDDPYTTYLDRLERQRLDEDLSGQFEGIGAVLTQRDGNTVIVEPMEDSPALRAGLRRDDVITEVDGEKIDGLILEEVVARIRGPKGTQVMLTILRGESTLTVKIDRGTIVVKSVSYEKKSSVGVIRLTQFGEDTAAGMREAIKDLESQGVDSYLIDLRDNPGGYLGVVRDITGFFLPPGSVVAKERFQGSVTDELKSKGAPLIPNKPIFVFVNGGSASASEILAGALQDYDRATVIGETSFGKGTVQEVINLRGSTALRLTIANWFTPNDRQIEGSGIEPDHKISAETAEEELEKALEYVLSL